MVEMFEWTEATTSWNYCSVCEQITGVKLPHDITWHFVCVGIAPLPLCCQPLTLQTLQYKIIIEIIIIITTKIDDGDHRMKIKHND